MGKKQAVVLPDDPGDPHDLDVKSPLRESGSFRANNVAEAVSAFTRMSDEYDDNDITPEPLANLILRKIEEKIAELRPGSLALDPDQIRQQIEENVDSFKDKAFFRELSLRNEEQIVADLQLAFLLLQRQKTLDEKESKPSQITETFLKAIRDEASNIPIKHFPYLTEAIHRYLFKINNPNHPVNRIGNPNDPDENKRSDGANTRRGLALSDEIAGFKWGRLLGGLLKLVVGGVLVSAAVFALAASFGSAAPLSAALVGLGVYVATPAAITGIMAAGSTAAAVVGAVTSVATLAFLRFGAGPGLYNIGKSFYDRFVPRTDNKIISKELLSQFTVFKPAPPAAVSAAPPDQRTTSAPGPHRKSE